MSRQLRWLDRELPAWVAEGLLSSEQAERIRAHYAAPTTGLPWALLIFSGLGAVILGLGIILLFAYNWEAMARSAKLAVIFGSLIAAHYAGLRLRNGPGWQPQAGEAFSLLGTMLFGAGIWLVAQVYHIEEHFPNGFLFWGLGALALAWAAQSVSQALLAVVILSIWNGTEALRFEQAIHWMPIGLLAAIGPLAWRFRSGLLATVILSSVMVSILINVGSIEGDLVIGMAIHLAAIFLALAVLLRGFTGFPQLAPIVRVIGWCCLIPSLYLLSFPDISEDLIWSPGEGNERRPLLLQCYLWLPCMLNVGLWVAAARRVVQHKPTTDGRLIFPYEYLAAPLAALLVQAFLLIPTTGAEWIIAGLFNLLFLGIAAARMARGCQEGLLMTTLTGSLLLVALALARYFDLFESLAWRGVVFLVVGATLFATGFQYSRNRKPPTTATP